MSSNRITLTLCLSLVIISTWAIVNFFTVRYDVGDNYPSYSTLRTDPLGAKAFYESLGQIPEITVKKNFTPYHEISDADFEPAALIQAGLQSISETGSTGNSLDYLNRFALQGGRVILTFTPSHRGGIREKKSDKEEAGTKQKNMEGERSNTSPKESSEDAPEKSPAKPLSKVYQQWGLKLQDGDSQHPKDDAAAFQASGSFNGKEITVPWYSPPYLIPDSNKWIIHLSVNDLPVCFERPWGKGSVFIATDSYFLSNEALWKKPQPVLLTTLVGTYKNIIFDESHLGLSHKKNIVVLAKQYKLHGLFLSLIFLAAMFIWKNAVSFGSFSNNPNDNQQYTSHEKTKNFDQKQSLINILKRSIPLDKLLPTALKEWQSSLPKNKFSTTRIETTAQNYACEKLPKKGKGQHVINAYNNLCQLLSNGDKNGQ